MKSKYIDFRNIKEYESEETIYKHDNSKVISTDYPIDELDKMH